MARYLSILEVSQKQAYIFKSKKVKDNIINSAIIAYVLSKEYLSELLSENGYSEEKNMVYSGGGHTILEFDSMEKAKRIVGIITESVYRQFDSLQIFAKIIEYDEAESPKVNLNNLVSALESKKSIRRSNFKQGSYGIEAIDVNTLDVVAKNISEDRKKVEEKENADTEHKFTPDGFKAVKQFSELGGTEKESNFIAVVHIDGNGMGKRVNDLYDSKNALGWEKFKKTIRQFSEEIDADFKEAYMKMVKVVADNIQKEKLNISLKDNNFPVRRIITAGDDICFVAEGRIGIECARIFLEKLSENWNKVDGQHYSACAGVAIVHQKYPFYRAYELAEMLCSNAKKYGAKIMPDDNGSSVSSIDWHVEFGEMKDSLEEIRKAYITADGNRLNIRPYIVKAPDKILGNKEFIMKKYDNFKKIIRNIMSNENKYGTGKIKGMRSVLKKGDIETKNYLKFNRMEDIAIDNRPNTDEISADDIARLFTGEELKPHPFVECDGCNRSILFDAIEIMDTFIEIEGGE